MWPFKTNAPQTTSPDSEEIDLVNMVIATHAVIRFKPDGEIEWANAAFLEVLGYTLDEIRGQNHSLFVDKTYREGAEYASFWDRLRKGETFTSQFPRVTKSGETVFIQACYSPVIGDDGKVRAVIKVASDITDRQLAITDIKKSLEALSTGDLTRHVAPCNAPDLNALGETYNACMTQLAALCSNITLGAGSHRLHGAAGCSLRGCAAQAAALRRYATGQLLCASKTSKCLPSLGFALCL